jgi:MinD-like ATPase involved in chromosome partitioning or flagellar assembly
MKTVKEFISSLERLKDKEELDFVIRFRYPYIYLDIKSAKLAVINEDEEKELWLANILAITMTELRLICNHGMISLQYVDVLEAKEPLRSTGLHWLSQLYPWDSKQEPVLTDENKIRLVHFYGYKGGQARSTVLATLACSLAEIGWKVLAVDADLEAPSLDLIFQKRTNRVDQSLLGIYLGEEPNPSAVYHPKKINSLGRVDLLACKPKVTEISDWDIEFSAFLIQANSDPEIIKNISLKIKNLAETNKYDIILLDHRSGLSVTPMFWMKEMRGPVAVLCKLDTQWETAKEFLQILFNLNSDFPGIFISHRPDDEEPFKFRDRNQDQIEDLLQIIQDVKYSGADDEEIEDQPLDDSLWIEWPYDQSYRSKLLPNPNDLNNETIKSIEQIRFSLGLGHKISKKIKGESVSLSPSGAQDAGILIHTDAILKLFNMGDNYNYIFGRKGTGKTRLFRALIEQKKERAILSPGDLTLDFGIQSDLPEVIQFAKKFENNPIYFWWSLLLSSLNSKNKVEQLNEWKTLVGKSGQLEYSEECYKLIQSSKSDLRYLIDGVETSFSGILINKYIEALFQFLKTIQNDYRINKKINIRLFLRTDLKKYGGENLEQQIADRSIYLFWDSQTALNFLLTRVYSNSWFKLKFKSQIDAMSSDMNKIEKGEILKIDECKEYLDKFFPEKIKRHKINLISFLKTYFSDASGTTDQEGGLSYYPRVYDSFISKISQPETISNPPYRGEPIEKDKIADDLIYAAHKSATLDYRDQVKDELAFMIEFNEDSNNNRQLIGEFLNQFSGEQTPFKPDELADSLCKKMNKKLDIAKIKTALQILKEVGIFEVWPKNPGQWRVGKLFKFSLNMKFRR